MAWGDIAFRGLQFAVDLKGYFTYGTGASGYPSAFSSVISGMDGMHGYWYEAAREYLAFKDPALLYTLDHLSNTSLPRQYNVAYEVLIGCLGQLINMNRLAIQGVEYSNLTRYIPRYMSRITRCWRRTSTLAAMSLARQQGLDMTVVPFWPGILAPVFRWYTLEYAAPATNHIPTLSQIATELDFAIENTDADTHETFLTMIEDLTGLNVIVTWLERLELWLEMGDNAIGDDFRAFRVMRDKIAVCGDARIAASYVRGLPDSATLPGFTPSKEALTDYVLRLLALKQQVPLGTDGWLTYPVDGVLELEGQIPVMGLGQPTLFDYTNFGVPKFAYFSCNAGMPESWKANVNDDMICDGTRHHVTLVPEGASINGAVVTGDLSKMFGQTQATALATQITDEEIAYKGKQQRSRLYWVGGPDALLRPAADGLSIAEHEFFRRFVAFESSETVVMEAQLAEGDFDYIYYIEPRELAMNTIQLLQQTFALPTLHWSPGMCGG
jgi:hypothetical protein